MYSMEQRSWDAVANICYIMLSKGFYTPNLRLPLFSEATGVIMGVQDSTEGLLPLATP